MSKTVPAAPVRTGRFTALKQLVLSRIRLFLREPAAVFWVYGFPILMLVALGIAFREDTQPTIRIDLVGSGDLSTWERRLKASQQFEVFRPTDFWEKRLQSGKTDLVVEVDSAAPSGFRLWEEPRRAESRLARYAVQTMLLKSEADAADPEIKQLQQAGSRYIDFLLPGLIGMGLMGGGMWGVGFVVVDMRVRKLLKRFLATPMRRSDFLLP